MSYQTWLMVKITQLEMMRDRGYDISEEYSILELDIRNIDDIYKFVETYDLRDSKNLNISHLNRNYQHLENNNLTLVRYVAAPPDKTQIGIGSADILINEIKQIQNPESIGKNKIEKVIIITDSNFGPRALEELYKIKEEHLLQHFLWNQLVYNPTKHKLVPKHYALTPAETEEFLSKDKITRAQLAKIAYAGLDVKKISGAKTKISDPIVAYYGWVPGQIIRIHREDTTTDTLVNKSLFYRHVSYVG